MNNITCIETYIDSEKNFYGSYLIEPLEIGQGITLGNSLRRTLLADLYNFAITGVRINNLIHEFSNILGIREDILEIILNLKEIIFKTSSIINIKNKNLLFFKSFLHVQGPSIITAGMFYLPKNLLKIINPKQYLCTILNKSNLYLEIDIKKGSGYHLSEEIKLNNLKTIFKQKTFPIDNIFMPIKNVNYKIKLIHDNFGNLKESLILEIITNGSITPIRSIQEANKILMNIFYSLFLNPIFFNIFSKLKKNI